MPNNFENTSAYISVIVTAYNIEKYIGRCLEHLVNQSFKDIEIIIVDDNSTDKTAEIIKGFAKQDKRIIFLQNSVNKGVSYARNVGLKHAKGKYVHYVDGDDYLALNAYELIYKRLNTLPVTVDILLLNFTHEKLTGVQKAAKFHKRLLNQDVYSGEDAKKIIFNSKVGVTPWRRLHLREFLERNKLYFKENLYFEDVLYYWQVIVRANTFSYVTEPVYFYCSRPNSIMDCTRRFLTRGEDVFTSLEHAFSYLKEHGYLKTYNYFFIKKLIRTYISFFRLYIKAGRGKEYLQLMRDSFKRMNLHYYTQNKFLRFKIWVLNSFSFTILKTLVKFRLLR